MSQRLLNKVAIITGSTDGIGYSIAQQFLKEGSKVVISSRKAKNVNYAVEKLKTNFNKDNIRGLVCNVSIPLDRSKLITEVVRLLSIIINTVNSFGKIDVLVSNAACNVHFGPIMECSEEAWDKIFDTNLKSTFFLIKESMPHFNNKASVIINSSIAGFLPLQFLGIYSISKTALIGMVKALSKELANPPLEIRVNGIAPGIIKTKFSRPINENEAISTEIMKMLHLKRFGTGADCAGVATFLASEDAAYVTGETIVVAGGLPSRL